MDTTNIALLPVTKLHPDDTARLDALLVALGASFGALTVAKAAARLSHPTALADEARGA